MILSAPYDPWPGYLLDDLEASQQLTYGHIHWQDEVVYIHAT